MDDRTNDPSEVDGVWWTRDELAWPLAILLGFGGAWSAQAVSQPWLAIALPAALFVPLQASLAARGRIGLAAWISLGWLAGIAGASAGGVLEADRVADRPEVVGAAHYASFFAVPSSTATSPAAGPAWVAWHAAAFGLALVLGRASRGALGLALVAFGGGTLASAVTVAAFPAIEAGVAPLWAALVATPPHLALELGALAMASVATGAPSGSDARGKALRRTVVLGACVVEVFCLAGGAWWGEVWGAWAQGQITPR